MSDPEACGSEEKQRFLPEFEDVNQFMQLTLKSVVQATKTSNEMPAAGDDWDYYSSFPGFQDGMNIEGKRILHVVQSILKHQNVRVNLESASGAADIEDKLDLLMDANDQILERVGTWLDEASGIKKNDSSLVVATATPKTPQPSASWNKKSPGKSGSSPSFRLLSARNIQRPQLKFRDKVDNSLNPFRPVIKHKHHALVPLEESLVIPDGTSPEMTEKADFKHPHPYQYEIDHLTYRPDQLVPCTDLKEPATLAETPITFVDKLEQLDSVLQHLKRQDLIAVDLEHHSYRTFQGITCLMQLSTLSHDFLVDTIALRSDLQCLNEVFADPDIVKVLHGADMDIEWLQRDLGLYVVNMFDTGQAARVLNFSRFSLAHLLQQYCGVKADKQYQLADWRIRPLPEELQRYAREDTHYLLYIYSKLQNELIDRGNDSNNLLTSVLHRSAQLCLKVYKKPMNPADGYLELYKKNKKVFNSQQLLALKELFTWRDETARMEDESYGYVLPNHMLLQICDILPRERQGILACCNPIPPLVRQYLNEIHAVIKKAREAPLHKVEPVRSHRPTQHQHPKYNVNSLLHCPHDMTHSTVAMDTDSNTCLLDSSLVATKSSLFPSTTPTVSSSVITMKKQSILTIFDTPMVRAAVKTAVQKQVEKIKARFMNPYTLYMPEDDTKPSTPIKPARLSDVSSAEVTPWKLLPCSVKRKKTETTDHPTKRSKTDLQEDMGKRSHLKFTDEGEPIEITDDDKKALPRDIEIPLRFQAPSQSKKKKKKKDRNRDIDIISSVQDHIANIRKLQEESERAIGENAGDAQPHKLTQQSKPPKVTAKQWKEEKTQKSTKSPETDPKTSGSKDSKSDSKRSKNSGKDAVDNDTDDLIVTKVEGVDKQRKVKTNQISENTTEVAIEIDSECSSDGVEIVKEEFQPFNYAEGAKQLLRGARGGQGHSRDYYKPDGFGGQGKNKNMRNRSKINKNQKSMTWKSNKK